LLNPKYAFISAYLKSLEPKLVTSEQVTQMAKTAHVPEALAVISNSDVGRYLEDKAIATFDEMDQQLWGYFAHCLQQVAAFQFLPRDVLKISRSYIAKYDVVNIKVALQGLATGRSAGMIPLGVIHDCHQLETLSRAQSIEDIHQLLVFCQLENYAAVLAEHKGNGSPQARLITETRLDSEYFKDLMNMTRRVKDGAVLAKAFGLTIDLTNLEIVSRAIINNIGVEVADYTIMGGYLLSAEAIREMLTVKLSALADRLTTTPYADIATEIATSYDRSGTITAVNDVIDKHRYQMLRHILAPRVLSPLVMAWYLVLKEIEIRNLRLVIKALLNNIPLDEIKDYLVLS